MKKILKYIVLALSLALMSNSVFAISTHVHLDPNGASNASSFSDMTITNTTNFKVNFKLTSTVPVREGCTFDGWVVTSTSSCDVDQSEYAAGATIETYRKGAGTGHVYLKARWKYTRTFTFSYDTDGGVMPFSNYYAKDGTVYTAADVIKSQTYTVTWSSLNNDVDDAPKTYSFKRLVSDWEPIKEGYYFVGWYIDDTYVENLGPSVVTREAFQNGVCVQTARWRNVTYTIHFDGNGSTSGSVADMTVPYNYYRNGVEGFYLPKCDFVRAFSVSYDADGGNTSTLSDINIGCESSFAGWVDSGSSFYYKNETYSLSVFDPAYYAFVPARDVWQDVDIYCRGTANRYDLIRHYVNYGSKAPEYRTHVSPDGSVVPYGTNVLVTNLCSEDGGTITLKAKWVDNPVRLPSATRDGYIFKGWYDGTVYAGGSNDVYQPSRSLTLKAAWEPLKYVIKGVIANGSMSPQEPQTVARDQKNEPIVFTPDPDYDITGVMVNGVAVDGWTASSYTYPSTVVTEDVTIEVSTAKVRGDMTVTMYGLA
ncbi:MAG: InlB B-repeat-containing protein, partial [Bacteroidales bacterium]|nr:InlB B-repeat-containing protein [Bacteroidales bacterium]